MSLSDFRGPFGDSLPRLDRWTINPRDEVGANRVREETIDERSQEFPRCHPDRSSRPYRYGYTVATQTDSFPHIFKHDLKTGTTGQIDLGPGRHAAEPVFVPRQGATLEDDGYLMTYVYDEATKRSEFLILDAQDMGAPVIARVHLPVRVPNGFHGNWVPDTVVSATG